MYRLVGKKQTTQCSKHSTNVRKHMNHNHKLMENKIMTISHIVYLEVFRKRLRSHPLRQGGAGSCPADHEPTDLRFQFHREFGWPLRSLIGLRHEEVSAHQRLCLAGKNALGRGQASSDRKSVV